MNSMRPPSLRFRALLAMQSGPMCCPAAELAALQSVTAYWMQPMNVIYSLESLKSDVAD